MGKEMACGRCGIPRSEIDAEAALATVPEMLEKLRVVSDFGGKEGGVFCLVEISTGEYVVEPTVIGRITNGKEDQYSEYCKEKAVRLRKNKGHWLSWQTRDEALDQWGGAICDGEYIWSFSGLEEDQDEALMLMTAHMCGRIMHGAPRNYAEISDNRIILGSPRLFWKRDVADEDEREPQEIDMPAEAE